MQPGVIGLGRMGANMARRLIRKDHECVTFDMSPAAVEALVQDKATGASSARRWTIKAAIDEAVPAPVLTSALYERFSSRGDAELQNRVMSAMRHPFGGHVEKTGN